MTVFPVRAYLREATAASHERVDQAFGAIDLRDPVAYGDFLVAQARAHLPVEASLERCGIAADLPDWSARRRADALRDDLADLDRDVPEPLVAPSFRHAPERLGAAYVLEGSRLGGAMLVRTVPSDLPRRFLGAGAGGMWRTFLGRLDELVKDDGRKAAADAALAVFAMFDSAARGAGGSGRP